jgi:predicted MPP superfamily phosphohydrolase
VILNSLRLLADAAAVAAVIWAQWKIGSWALATVDGRPAWMKNLVRLLAAAMCVCLAVGFALGFHRVARVVPFPASVRGILGGGAYLWMFTTTGAYLIHRIRLWLLSHTKISDFDPGRRRLVAGAGNALVAAPFALAGFGTLIQRTDFRVREIDIPIPNLPRDLQGLRILQLTDIHMGPFLSESDFVRVIDESLNLRPHLAVITGDLISTVGDPLDACLRQIARLRADAGILGCMGNHENYAQVQAYTAQQGAQLGIDFLRGRARSLRFGAANLNVAGVDYYSISNRKAYLAGVERLVKPGEINLLLSHNPDVFPVAARQEFDFTISGHTHGGQVNIEILNQSLNAASFITPFVYGHYRQARPSGPAASLYVSRGIGTIGLPARIGAPPEISLLRLVAG